MGPAAIIEHGRTGWLVPVGDIQGMAATLSSALASGAALLHAGAAGKLRCRSEFGAVGHARATEAIYGQALGRL